MTRAGPVMPDAGQMPQPEVSVVIPYYDDQPRLTLLLRALDQQVCDERFDVVIADDGSPEPPVVPDGLGFGCTVVRQADEGFRAAAARNLGAASAAGGLLLFLDGDTLPAAGYVAAMCRTLRAIDDGHGTLVVGRRRHADLGEAHDASGWHSCVPRRRTPRPRWRRRPGPFGCSATRNGCWTVTGAPTTSVPPPTRISGW